MLCAFYSKTYSGVLSKGVEVTIQAAGGINCRGRLTTRPPRTGISSTPKCMIISVLIMTDHPCYKCNKSARFKNEPSLATGNQPDQTDAPLANVLRAEAPDEKPWLSDDR
jgi:hypothetical protein